VNVFVSVDIEGITGVVNEDQTKHGSDAWRRACGLMRADLDAVLDGCLSAGAQRIVVTDGHDMGDNLSARDLPPQVTLVSGSEGNMSMMAGLEAGCDAALLIGYHAMAGTADAVLAHTWCEAFWEVAIGEPGGGFRPIGELGLNAALAGSLSVPVVVVSGDDRFVTEAATFLPGVTAVTTKRGLGRQAAALIPPVAVHEAMRTKVEQALTSGPRPPLLKWDGLPLRLILTTVEAAEAIAGLEGVRRLDGRSVVIERPDYLSTFRTFLLAAGLVYG
jgi:D-amino peptidase